MLELWQGRAYYKSECWTKKKEVNEAIEEESKSSAPTTPAARAEHIKGLEVHITDFYCPLVPADACSYLYFLIKTSKNKLHLECLL